ncbi:hypothetical protein A2531_06495 [Candidatus Falkowbacteria bacterium RIFOXYD2_FULL_34_120]|uniref:FeS cluster biogenesis domain-containing protein n=1 Tax=Candidatus Falkowbacteria bacterium RIFOXYD2_FULL_34_120 TaxID=1798007 RepID=A0A1F5TMQ7_9BACT|nr:MAG: hypothetical protein A2500_05105 [Candidatus Falkowbacteria bacterium RIFOXYC12_FULL_34_55]OGF38012.1 MAG: hypothetical protein A2466_03815 [Candidatus Falkowbacteria bacterium RIFOXYC2_FULL_34_220]OGF38267.1 MAG: hypothetical protein A2515_00725 [Candidatus Falkowbacteria bacterium RIFOXYD12_FULL_34_57]OGF40166.1 MAG: hypothetical protein A2531_06495 [Candidatus Falkowbacteria bacterium RIFOXYD2_FULL_34_120]
MDWGNPENDDEIFNIDGVKFLIKKDLLAKAKPITINYIDDGGFVFTSGLAKPNCGGCAKK